MLSTALKSTTETAHKHLQVKAKELASRYLEDVLKDRLYMEAKDGQYSYSLSVLQASDDLSINSLYFGEALQDIMREEGLQATFYRAERILRLSWR